MYRRPGERNHNRHDRQHRLLRIINNHKHGYLKLSCIAYRLRWLTIKARSLAGFFFAQKIRPKAFIFFVRYYASIQLYKRHSFSLPGLMGFFDSFGKHDTCTVLGLVDGHSVH